MTWTRLEDGIFDHPKMLRAGEDAANLFVRALVYCNRHLTDGRLHPEVLPALTRREDVEQLAERLVRVGAWEVHPEGGWVVHDFHAFNPAAEEVIAKRAALSAKRAEAGKRGGLASGVARSNEANAKQTPSKVLAGVEAKTNPRPDPSPSPSLRSGGGAGGEGAEVAPVVAPGSADPSAQAAPESPKPEPEPEPAPQPAPEKPRRQRTRKAPQPDTIPLPGTVGREAFDAIVADPVLRPITSNPGDFASRVASGMFPSLAPQEVVAGIKRAGLHASSKPGAYRDGRRFLTAWLTRDNEAAALRPRVAEPPPKQSTPELPRRAPKVEAPSAEFLARTRERIAAAQLPETGAA